MDRVDRFSVGVQSLDDELLKQMDRYDKYGSAFEILERLMSIEDRFHSLNVDMIFNFPSQSEESLLRDIERLMRASAGTGGGLRHLREQLRIAGEQILYLRKRGVHFSPFQKMFEFSHADTPQVVMS